MEHAHELPEFLHFIEELIEEYSILRGFIFGFIHTLIPLIGFYTGWSINRLLNELQKTRNVKPMTIYRSLNSLQKMGVVHKSNQNKTYFVCHGNAKDKHNPALAVCRDCGDTEELKSELFEAIFKKNPIKKYDFSKFQLEVSITCRRCN